MKWDKILTGLNHLFTLAKVLYDMVEDITDDGKVNGSNKLN